MKAVCISKPHHAEYGIQPVPVCSADQVLVKVGAVGICYSDVELFEGSRPAPYASYPITPGHEWSGTVIAVGSNVKHLRVSQRVAVEGHNFCSKCYFCLRGETNLCEHYNEIGFTLPGAYAEMVAVSADLAHPFSESIPFHIAALTEPTACAEHAFRKAGIHEGDTVCVIGPGSIGLLCVAWAKTARPRYIIVVGLDRVNERFAKKMGATHYLTMADNPEEKVKEITNGTGADAVIEAAGTGASVKMALTIARRGGNVSLVGVAGNNHLLSDLPANIFCLKDLNVRGVFAYTSKGFERALRAIEDGSLQGLGDLVTHQINLEYFEKAFHLLRSRAEPIVKIVLLPPS